MVTGRLKWRPGTGRGSTTFRTEIQYEIEKGCTVCSRSAFGEWGDGFAHLCEPRFSINPQGEHAADGPAVHVQIVTKSAGGEHFQNCYTKTMRDARVQIVTKKRWGSAHALGKRHVDVIAEGAGGVSGR